MSPKFPFLFEKQVICISDNKIVNAKIFQIKKKNSLHMTHRYYFHSNIINNNNINSNINSSILNRSLYSLIDKNNSSFYFNLSNNWMVSYSLRKTKSPHFRLYQHIYLCNLDYDEKST